MEEACLQLYLRVLFIFFASTQAHNNAQIFEIKHVITPNLFMSSCTMRSLTSHL